MESVLAGDQPGESNSSDSKDKVAMRQRNVSRARLY